MKMKIEQATQKAIEGGYDAMKMNPGVYNINQYAMFLDPLFWKALGKAMKLDTENHTFIKSDWKGLWHRFIDHLAEGGTIESFFETL